MKVEDNRLLEVFYCNTFGEMLVIDDIKGLILDSIKVYGISNKGIHERVDFYIRNITGKAAIYPTCGWYEGFYIEAKRAIHAKVVTINAGDYFDKTMSKAGDFTFIMNNDRKNI